MAQQWPVPRAGSSSHVACSAALSVNQASSPLGVGIHVSGFQASQGLAMDFSTRLKWVRPGVRFAEARAGVFSEVLDSDPARECLVLIDTASYARKAIQLARKARDRSLPTTS